MKIQFSSIEYTPRSLPPWQMILDDLSNPPALRVARVLGISERTVYRYNQTGDAPRIALLALFWLTRWGRSQVHSQAVNDAALAFQIADGLRAEVSRLESNVRYLSLLGSGAANGPLIGGPDGR